MGPARNFSDMLKSSEFWLRRGQLSPRPRTPICTGLLTFESESLVSIRQAAWLGKQKKSTPCACLTQGRKAAS